MLTSNGRFLAIRVIETCLALEPWRYLSLEEEVSVTGKVKLDPERPQVVRGWWIRSHEEGDVLRSGSTRNGLAIHLLTESTQSL